MTNSTTISTHQDPNGRWTILQGEVQHVSPTLLPNPYDGLFCDAPYGIDFMKNGWDAEVPPTSVWRGLLHLCKPGAFLLSFGGTKTFHRMFSNIEDAGWEIRDTLCWLHGRGFPKGHDLSKGIDRTLGLSRPVIDQRQNLNEGRESVFKFGFETSSPQFNQSVPASDLAADWNGYNTALKPAWEPIVLAQKPRSKTFARNAIRFSCGGLNIKECQIGSSGGTKRSHQAPYPTNEDGSEDRQHWARTGHEVQSIDEGRWPANLLLDEEAAEELDKQGTHSTSRKWTRRKAGSVLGNGKTLGAFVSRMDTGEGYDDEGGPSRFFYVGKASPKDRAGNDHPTVKPLSLCEYLARLIRPPERGTQRHLLVPFSGSGSEMIGALQAGWDHVTGIERDPHYVEIAKRRLSEFDEGSAMPV
jgi:site-specific DNA-methyltransferase (adenine-specific)